MPGTASDRRRKNLLPPPRWGMLGGWRPSGRRPARSRHTHRAPRVGPEAPGTLSLRTTAARATRASPPPGQAHPHACALCILGAVAAMLNPYREASGGDGGDHRRAGGRGPGEAAASVRSGVSGHRSGPCSPRDPVHDPRQCSETSPSWPWGGRTRDPAQPVRVPLTWPRGPDAFPHPQRLGKGGAGGYAPSPNAFSASGGVDTPDSVLPPSRAEGEFRSPPPWLLDPGELGPLGRGRRRSFKCISKGGEWEEFLGFRRKKKDPKGERLVFQTPDSQWECGPGPAREGHWGEGNGQPRAYVPIGGQRGEGGVRPLASVPWGYGTLEPGETGSFWRARGGRAGGPSGMRELWSRRPRR